MSVKANPAPRQLYGQKTIHAFPAGCSVYGFDQDFDWGPACPHSDTGVATLRLYLLEHLMRDGPLDRLIFFVQRLLLRRGAFIVREPLNRPGLNAERSEERRVGKECRS